MISGHGFNSPDIILVEDHAHGDDFRTEHAISGHTEKILRGLSDNAGLNFESMWKTALIKEEPSIILQNAKNAKDYISQNANISEQYVGILKNEIKELSPNLIIPLGELSFHVLTGLQGIRKYRGSVLPPNPILELRENTKILPILGPYPYLNQEPKLEYISRIDFAKIGKYSGNTPIPEQQYSIWVAKSAGSLRNYLERSYKAEGLLVFDIETFYGVITCISFCFDGYESVCIPFCDPSVDLDNCTLMASLVAKVLASPIKKVNQNIKFDWKNLERWGFTVNNVFGDTLLRASTLYCEFPKNLGFLTSIYTELPYHKDEAKGDWDPFKFKKDRLYLYCAKDSLATYQIFDKQEKELDELNVRNVYEQSIRLLPIYKRAENRGLRVDHEMRNKLFSKYDTLFNLHLSKYRRYVNNDESNPLSSKQMNIMVYETLGFKRQRVDAKTEEETLELLMVSGETTSSDPTAAKLALQEIINCRKLHKVLEFISLDLYPDGRMRCEYNLAGTENGRTSAGQTFDYLLKQKGSKYVLKKLGHSFQTIGKHGFMIDGETFGQDIRAMFVPTYGYVFLEIDQSGAESRVVRVLSGNFDLSVYKSPGIHKLTGSWVFQVPPHEIKKNILVNGIDRYHMAKTVRHAGERNMKEYRLVLMTQLPFSTCKTILSTFHKFSPEIQQTYFHDVRQIVRDTRALVAPNGRRRDFFDALYPQSRAENVFNEAISFLPQAIVGDQTKTGIENFYSTKESEGCEMLVEAHDGVTFEVPKDKIRAAAESYKRGIEIPIDFNYCSIKRDYQLTIPVEAEFSDTNWHNMQSYDL